VSLCQSLNIGIEDIKEQVLEGVFSKELLQYLLGRDHQDENSLWCDIMNFECMNEHSLQRIQWKQRLKSTDQQKVM